MKTGDLKNLSLTEIVVALQTQNLKKQDFVVPSKFIKMKGSKLQVINGDKLNSLSDLLLQTGISFDDEDTLQKMELQVLDCCHTQIGSKLEIPKKYYHKMLPEKYHALLDYNVTSWFQDKDTNFLLRTFIDKDEKTGVARAMLSDRYNVIDNYDVMLATLEAIKESGINIQIESGDITDTKFYMRFVCPDIELEAPDLLKNYRVPDGTTGSNGIISGFVISNSETGNGKFSISPRAIVLACRNGMIFKNDAFQKTHLGSKMEEYSTIDWSEETRQKNYDLVISQVKDAIKHFASQEYLGAKIHELLEKGNKELVYPIEAMKNVTKSLAISDEKESSILNYFVKSGDTNAFGLTQALTYFAQHNATPEERYEIEINSVLVLDNIEEFDKPLPIVKRVPSSQIVNLN
jgi:hypothetical protein